MNLQYFGLLSLSGADVMRTICFCRVTEQHELCLHVMLWFSPFSIFSRNIFFIFDTQPCVFSWWYSPQRLEPAHFHRLVCKRVHLLHNSLETIIFLGGVLIDEVDCTADTFCLLGNNACSHTLYLLFKVRRARMIKYKSQEIFWPPAQGVVVGEEENRRRMLGAEMVLYFIRPLFSMIASPRGHKQSWILIYREWRMSSILDTHFQNSSRKGDIFNGIATHTLKNSLLAWVESTPVNSNHQGKQKHIRVIGSSRYRR